MSTLELVGNTSLNVSTFLYLILLIPQVVHNQKTQNIAGLSLSLHFLLYISYATDMLYGIADEMPLQYKLVSVIGLVLVMTQHMQLVRYFVKQRLFWLMKVGLLFVALHFAVSYFFFEKLQQGAVTDEFIMLLGVIARSCEIIYCIPQVIKNRLAKSASAVSIHFIYINLMVAFLDTLSAWCLDWEWPNKFVAPVNIFIMLIIIMQHRKYAPVRHFHAEPNTSKLALASTHST